MRKKCCFRFLVFCMKYFWLTCSAQVNSFAKSGLQLVWSREVPFEQYFTCKKWQPCPVRLPAYCRAQIIASQLLWWNTKFASWPRRELKKSKNNHDLSDCFACTVPCLVHHWALSSQSFAVAMTDLPDSERRRNKLVMCFSDCILILQDWFVVRRVARVEHVFFLNSTVPLSKKTGLDWL